MSGLGLERLKSRRWDIGLAGGAGGGGQWASAILSRPEQGASLHIQGTGQSQAQEAVGPVAKRATPVYCGSDTVSTPRPPSQPSGPC